MKNIKVNLLRLHSLREEILEIIVDGIHIQLKNKILQRKY
jgi:hypothetical protein